MAQSLVQGASERGLVEGTYTPAKGIVFNGSPETTLDDYFASVSKSIDPDHITHASYIRGNRVCMFFSKENDVTTLLKSGGLEIKDSFSHCHRFSARPCTVILSNCLPFISDEQLLRTLSKIGTVVSPMKDVLVDTDFDNFKHIRSFRKTVEMIFPDINDVPYTVAVEYRNKRVPIYVCVENLKCEKCKLFGHCMAHCPLSGTSARTWSSASSAEEETRRSRPKTAPIGRLSSPFTSFFYRHGATLTREAGLTSSIDFSRESIGSGSLRNEHAIFVAKDSDGVDEASEKRMDGVTFEEPLE